MVLRLLLLSNRKGDVAMRQSFLRTAVSIAVLGASALAAGTADAWNAPGISQPSYPAFTDYGTNPLTLQFGLIGGSQKSIHGYTAPTGDYVLAAFSTDDGAFFSNSNSFKTINDESYSMDAVFNSKGQWLSGGVTIYGCSPPGSSCSKTSNLYTATFDKFGIATSPVGLGFETNISTVSGWAKQFQSFDESLYLYAANMAPLDNALASGKNIPTYFTVNDVAGWTTVPLPAAGWLFGSALIGIFGVMRRRPSRSGTEALDTMPA
jgi:hypothetical protein